MKLLKDINLENKKVLLRVDFNVPIEENTIIDDSRITSSLKTINYILEQNAKLIIFSHLGRVKEEKDIKKYSLQLVAKHLSKLLNKEVIFINETRGKKLEDKIANMNNKDIILVENTRFEDYKNQLESNCDEELSSYWASLGDVFINDAFALAHRKHASNVGIARNIKEKAIGFLIEKELNALEKIKNTNNLIGIMGGSKISDKINLIKNLLPKSKKILIGGGMANTFIQATGKNIGKSLVEEDKKDLCKDLIKDKKIILPIDFKASKDLKSDYKNKEEIEDEELILDIGEKTINLFIDNLDKNSTIFWNGPLGLYEKEIYADGTNKILKYLVDNDIKTILGGGDIVAACTKIGYKDKIYYASTGGGATLKYLEQNELDGLKVME